MTGIRHSAGMPKQPEFVTAREAALILGCTTEWVSRLARDGVLNEEHKMPGIRGARLFRRDEVTRVAVERSFRHVQEVEDAAEAG